MQLYFSPSDQNIGSSGTNVTINLSGLILLGIGVALGALAYMYVEAFKRFEYFSFSDHHGGDYYYDRKFRRKVR